MTLGGRRQPQGLNCVCIWELRLNQMSQKNSIEERRPKILRKGKWSKKPSQRMGCQCWPGRGLPLSNFRLPGLVPGIGTHVSWLSSASWTAIPSLCCQESVQVASQSLQINFFFLLILFSGFFNKSILTQISRSTVVQLNWVQPRALLEAWLGQTGLGNC